MSLKIGIVGLPNVGKSTLFNALVKNAQAEASNYPFCTIDPNVGIVEVPDERLAKLTEISKSQKTIPTAIEFIDIAGLVKNASKGEGLGNQFLSRIREADAIAMVVRFFENKDIVHIEGKIDPAEDIKVINLELILADLSIVEKKLESISKDAKAGDKKALAKKEILQKIKEGLDNEKPVREIISNPEELALLNDVQLITTKPMLYIANVSEEQLIHSNDVIANFCQQVEMKQSKDRHAEFTLSMPEGLAMTENFVPISAKTEAELSELSDEEQQEYLESLGLSESGLIRLIHAAYKTLGLITYFTSGEKETRAWTVTIGDTAPVAAGKIHTDFQKGFIAADVIKYDDFINNNGWHGTKEKGLIKTEGKTYIVQDGDIMLFKFNV